MSAGQSSMAAHIGHRLAIAFGKGRRFCARAMDRWPVRLLVVLTGIVMSDATVLWVVVHFTIHVYVDGPQDAFDDYCQISTWFLRGFFVAIFFAKYLPRAVAIFLLIFACVSYAIFIAGHFHAFHVELWKYREVPAAAVVFILGSLPHYIDYGFPAARVYSPLIFPLSFFARHIISILSIAFLYEVAFGKSRAEPGNDN